MTLAGDRDALTSRTVSAVGLGWAGALVVYCIVAVWLILHPAALPSDDALFFSRGLVRFSILDFSPQFPGYPGFIALGRLVLPLFGDPVQALFALTVAIALALPPVAALLAWRLTRHAARALTAFALTLTCPLLPDIALNLLSDGAGILFTMLALSALASDSAPTRRAIFIAGLALGWAMSCRPSDAVLVAGAVAAVAWRMPRRALWLAGGIMLVGLPVLGVLLALEGRLYVWAGLHFVTGHALDWGNTAFSHGDVATGWLGMLVETPAALALAVVLLGTALAVLGRARSVPLAMLAAAFAFLAHALWVLVMQNPQHLRHLAPLAVLGALLIAGLPIGRTIWRPLGLAVLALNAGVLVATTTIEPARAPPLVQAAGFLTRQPSGGVLAINDGVELMRSILADVRVNDMQAPADAALAVEAAGGGYRLSTTRLDPPALAVFSGRFAGEHTQYLYRLDATGRSGSHR